MIPFGCMLALGGAIVLLAALAQSIQNHSFLNSKRISGRVSGKTSRQGKNGRIY